MAVCIRLARHGRLHRPFFRIVAIDKRCHREGETNEILGTYDPTLAQKPIAVDMDKVNAWIKDGALLSAGLKDLLKHHGYAVPVRTPAVNSTPGKEAPKPKDTKKGETPKGTFVAASRRAVKKHELTKKKSRLEAEKAAKAAAAPAPEAEAPKA